MSHTKKSATLLGKTDDFQALLSDMTTAKENAQAAAAGAGLDGIVDTESDLPPAKAGNSGEHWLAHQDSTGRSEAIYRSDGSSWVFTGISLVNNQDPSVNRNVPTVSDLKDTSTTNWNSVFVRGQGNYWWEPGRDKADHDGIFVIDPDHSENASPDNSAWFQSQNTGTGCWVRGVPDQINVDKAGAVADWDGSSGTNNLPLFEAVEKAADKYGVRHIHMSSGDYYLDDTFEIRHDVRLTGEGAYRVGPKTTLHFPANTTGVYVVNKSISGGDDTNGTELRRFALNCTSQDTTGHGLHTTSTISMVGLKIREFAEHGVFLDGDGSDKNVNQWYAQRVNVFKNGGHGVYLDGGDANAGTGVNIDAISNGGYGILDSSFLGNTYIGCHTSANGNDTSGGAYKAEGANLHSVFIGCYAEVGQREIFMGPRCVFIAGETGDVPFNGNGQYIRASSFRKVDIQDSDNDFEQITINAGSNIALYALANDHSAAQGFGLIWNGLDGNYAVEVETEQRRILQFLTQDNTQNFGRSTPPSEGVFVTAPFVGANFNDARLLGYEASAPDDGGDYGAILDLATGDTVLNAVSGLGEPIGWRCVSGGSPGTWEPFGQAGHRESSGDPTGSVTPSFVGEEVLDTTNEVWYKSTGTSNSDWVALNP
jgi:hypothetical protein